MPNPRYYSLLRENFEPVHVVDKNVFTMINSFVTAKYILNTQVLIHFLRAKNGKNPGLNHFSSFFAFHF